jgi:hypothetical protein
MELNPDFGYTIIESKVSLTVRHHKTMTQIIRS